jgi:hypothetical protein
MVAKNRFSKRRIMLEGYRDHNVDLFRYINNGLSKLSLLGLLCAAIG